MICNSSIANSIELVARWRTTKSICSSFYSSNCDLKFFTIDLTIPPTIPLPTTSPFRIAF